MKKRLIGVMAALVGATAGAGVTGRTMAKKLSVKQELSDRHLALFLLMNQWVKVKQNGKNLEEYFTKNGYQKIAVYGMSYVGETFLEELKGTEVKAAYGIDKKSDKIYADIDILSPDDELSEVDAVVVTAITFFDEIEEMLSEKLDCPIISLEDILYEL